MEKPLTGEPGVHFAQLTYVSSEFRDQWSLGRLGFAVGGAVALSLALTSACPEVSAFPGLPSELRALSSRPDST